jgi:lipid A 3-O-deacylase
MTGRAMCARATRRTGSGSWRPRAGTSALLRAAVSVALAASVAPAQGWQPHVQLDNDVYNFWRRHTQRPDEEYTNGVRLSLVADRAPGWGGLRREPACEAVHAAVACLTTTLTIGQELYTPDLDRAPHSVPRWRDERPFFAWLYVSGTGRLTAERSLRSVEVSLGVTGPPAAGELAQRIAHSIGFNRPATGWETQVGFEPGIMAEYRHALLTLRRSGEGPGFDFVPEAGLTLGNIRTRAMAGGTLRIGWNLSHPWHTADGEARAPVQGWVSAGGQLEYVARDMSLDGTLRTPQRRVERVAGVRQHSLGIGLRVRAVELGWRAVTRSREYRTGPAHHMFSAMTAGLVVVP